MAIFELYNTESAELIQSREMKPVEALDRNAEFVREGEPFAWQEQDAVKIVCVNGFKWPLAEVIAANDFTPLEIAALEQLKVGEHVRFGGGAFEQSEIERVA